MRAMPPLEPVGRRVFRAVKPFPVILRRLHQQSLPQVDLRPAIQSLQLDVRFQEGRGTCSVFAMTFLLEYMYRSRLAVPANNLSEEYLNHAANLVNGQNGDGDYFDNIDAGY